MLSDVPIRSISLLTESDAAAHAAPAGLQTSSGPSVLVNINSPRWNSRRCPAGNHSSCQALDTASVRVPLHSAVSRASLVQSRSLAAPVGVASSSSSAAPNTLPHNPCPKHVPSSPSSISLVPPQAWQRGPGPTRSYSMPEKSMPGNASAPVPGMFRPASPTASPAANIMLSPRRVPARNTRNSATASSAGSPMQASTLTPRAFAISSPRNFAKFEGATAADSQVPACGGSPLVIALRSAGATPVASNRELRDRMVTAQQDTPRRFTDVSQLGTPQCSSMRGVRPVSNALNEPTAEHLRAAGSSPCSLPRGRQVLYPASEMPSPRLTHVTSSMSASLQKGRQGICAASEMGVKDSATTGSSTSSLSQSRRIVYAPGDAKGEGERSAEGLFTPREAASTSASQPAGGPVIRRAVSCSPSTSLQQLPRTQEPWMTPRQSGNTSSPRQAIPLGDQKFPHHRQLGQRSSHAVAYASGPIGVPASPRAAQSTAKARSSARGLPPSMHPAGSQGDSTPRANAPAKAKVLAVASETALGLNREITSRDGTPMETKVVLRTTKGKLTAETNIQCLPPHRHILIEQARTSLREKLCDNCTAASRQMGESLVAGNTDAQTLHTTEMQIHVSQESTRSAGCPEPEKHKGSSPGSFTRSSPNAGSISNSMHTSPALSISSRLTVPVGRGRGSIQEVDCQSAVLASPLLSPGESGMEVEARRCSGLSYFSVENSTATMESLAAHSAIIASARASPGADSEEGTRSLTLTLADLPGKSTPHTAIDLYENEILTFGDCSPTGLEQRARILGSLGQCECSRDAAFLGGADDGRGQKPASEISSCPTSPSSVPCAWSREVTAGDSQCTQVQALSADGMSSASSASASGPVMPTLTRASRLGSQSETSISHLASTDTIIIKTGSADFSIQEAVQESDNVPAVCISLVPHEELSLSQQGQHMKIDDKAGTNEVAGGGVTNDEAALGELGVPPRDFGAPKAHETAPGQLGVSAGAPGASEVPECCTAPATSRSSVAPVAATPVMAEALRTSHTAIAVGSSPRLAGPAAAPADGARSSSPAPCPSQSLPGVLSRSPVAPSGELASHNLHGSPLVGSLQSTPRTLQQAPGAEGQPLETLMMLGAPVGRSLELRPQDPPLTRAAPADIERTSQTILLAHSLLASPGSRNREAGLTQLQHLEKAMSPLQDIRIALEVGHAQPQSALLQSFTGPGFQANGMASDSCTEKSAGPSPPQHAVVPGKMHTGPTQSAAQVELNASPNSPRPLSSEVPSGRRSPLWQSCGLANSRAAAAAQALARGVEEAARRFQEVEQTQRTCEALHAEAAELWCKHTELAAAERSAVVRDCSGVRCQ